MPTVPAVQESLRALIAGGAWPGDRLPAERELVAALGASRTTVRRALARLEQDGVVRRAATGRVEIRRGDALRRIAFLAPAYQSDGLLRWEGALRRALAASHPGLHLASLRFVGWDDPVLGEAKRGCDGVFLLPGSEAPPSRTAALLAGPGAAVTAVESAVAGLPLLRLYPPSCAALVLDRLHTAGHRRIGWINTQPADATILALRDAYLGWVRDHGGAGPLLDDPVAPFEDPVPRARALVLRHLRAGGDPGASAWLCSVYQVARGAIRAFTDAGLAVGRTVSVATVDGEGQEEVNVPSLACIAAVDPAPLLARCVERMLAGTRARGAPPLLEPGAHTVFAGESLGPPG